MVHHEYSETGCIARQIAEVQQYIRWSHSSQESSMTSEDNIAASRSAL